MDVILTVWVVAATAPRECPEYPLIIENATDVINGVLYTISAVLAASVAGPSCGVKWRCVKLPTNTVISLSPQVICRSPTSQCRAGIVIPDRLRTSSEWWARSASNLRGKSLLLQEFRQFENRRNPESYPADSPVSGFK